MQRQNVTEGQKNTLSTEKTKWILISLIGKLSLYLTFWLRDALTRLHIQQLYALPTPYLCVV
jgi:hypothetical protein